MAELYRLPAPGPHKSVQADETTVRKPPKSELTLVNQGRRDSILAQIRSHGKTCGQVARIEGLDRAEVEQILLQEVAKEKELVARRAWSEGYRAGQLRPLPPTAARRAA